MMKLQKYMARTKPYANPAYDPRILAMGFYDRKGRWIYTMDRRQREDLSVIFPPAGYYPPDPDCKEQVRFRRIYTGQPDAITRAEYEREGLPT